MAPKVVLAIALGALVGLGCSSSVSPAAPSEMPSQPSAPPAPSPEPPPPAAPQTARYVVVFESVWSETSHPTEFPESAHYSGLIGGTHNGSVSFWKEGGLATEGIRRMAERGSKSPLDAEVSASIAAGTAEHLLSGPRLDDSPGSTGMEFDISQSFPLVTLVTMVAPSPDWFVGVSGLQLFRNNQWTNEVRVELHAYDAGTDSGSTYTSSDRQTVPAEPIGRVGYPVTDRGNTRPLGSFTFKRLDN